MTPMRIGFPNLITLSRLGLTVLFLVLLSVFDADRIAHLRWVLHAAFWVFLLAALTDIVDGLLARMTSSVTSFGRVVDPVVDKVLVCGAFVLLAGHQFWDRQQNVNITDVQPWMVVIILSRELLVSAVRSQVEAAGQEFGASWLGKLKMFVQSITICVILGQLAWQVEAARPVRTACVWATVLITVLSAVAYVRRARRFLLTGAPGVGAAAGKTGPSSPAPNAPSSSRVEP